MNDYIKLFRQITDWEWYQDTNTFKVFLHLLITANRFPKKWRGMDVGIGQKVTSVGHLAEETGLTVQNVRTALSHLKSTGEISQKSTNRFTLITVENYSLYQSDNDDTNKQLTNNQQTTNKQLTTNKKERKKESKNVYSSTTYLCQNVVENYNRICVSLPRVGKLTDKRKTHVNARLKEHSLDEIKMAFIKAEQSDFLSGRQKDWHADFDWITKSEDNIVKILEGHYDNRDRIRDETEKAYNEIMAGVDEEELRKAEEVLR